MGFERKMMIKSLKRFQSQKTGLAVVAGGLVFLLALFLLYNPYMLSYTAVSSSLSIDEAAITVAGGAIATKQIEPKDLNATAERKPICDFSSPRTDICEVNGDIRIHGNSSSILHIISSSETIHSWRIRPHPRKGDDTGMSYIREVTVKSSSIHEDPPSCTLIQNIPAIVFSTGGYMGNAFHDFTDLLIPLFLTSHHFHGEVQFLITDLKPWWISKYKHVLKQLTRYEMIDLDKDHRILCYPNAIVGLKFHTEMSIDRLRSPPGSSMLDFARLLRSSYSLDRKTAIMLEGKMIKKPRLMIISRKWSRKFTNLDELFRLAEELGFEAVAAESDVNSNLTEVAQTVNSFDVLMGVHGAGLTNLVFLPVNAVVIQVVPLGGLEGIARACFGRPSMDMKLRYLHYDITEEESSLIEEYPRDHPVLKDPLSVKKRGWLALRETYLVKQNVKLDVSRFRPVLIKALELLHQ